MNTERLEYFRQYRAEHREKHNAAFKRCYAKNREKYLSKAKEKRQNPELKRLANERAKEWYAKNRDTVSKRNRNRDEATKKLIYQRRNKDAIRAYYRKRLETDVNYKCAAYLRNRIKKVLKRNVKASKTSILLGATVSDVVNHLTSQFRDGMSWENYGYKGWHIDHILPCSAFDLTKPEDQKECFHYTNLQPLWWWENLSKSNKL